jgi:hypothetical protein
MGYAPATVWKNAARSRQMFFDGVAGDKSVNQSAESAGTQKKEPTTWAAKRANTSARAERMQDRSIRR